MTQDNPPQNAEFVDMVKSQIKNLEKDHSDLGTFRRLMLTHSLHSSVRGENMARKLTSLEEHQSRQDEGLSILSKAFEEFRTGRIVELETRMQALERKLFIATGALLTIWGLPQLMDLIKRLGL